MLCLACPTYASHSWVSGLGDSPIGFFKETGVLDPLCCRQAPFRGAVGLLGFSSERELSAILRSALLPSPDVDRAVSYPGSILTPRLLVIDCVIFFMALCPNLEFLWLTSLSIKTNTRTNRTARIQAWREGGDSWVRVRLRCRRPIPRLRALRLCK